MKKTPENLLFRLRLPAPRKGEPTIRIEARDGGLYPPDGIARLGGRTKILVEVRQGREVVFPFGLLYCGVGMGQTDDGPEARALAISLAGMKPGDTDAEYFEGYSPRQLEWAEANGEWLSLLASEREERNSKRKRNR